MLMSSGFNGPSTLLSHHHILRVEREVGMQDGGALLRAAKCRAASMGRKGGDADRRLAVVDGTRDAPNTAY
jgi:hypothetical protein